MKNIKYLFSIIFLLSLFSCNDLTEINENPNNVSETHPQLLLTKVAADAFKVEGTSPMNATRMIVSTDGESEEQYYKWNRASFDNYGKLRNVTKMKQEAERIESEAYIAISKFFRAYYFYKTTLTFGDIPYSEALDGESEIYMPKYDAQKDVFVGILNELEEANSLLRNSKEIIEGDIIYNGSTEQWRKLVNSFRLKVLMTLSNKIGDASLNVISEFSKIYNNEPIMESIADNGQLVFLDQEGSRYTEFNSSSYGSGRYMASQLVDMMKDREDARLFIYSGRTKQAKEAGLAIDDFQAYNGGNPLVPYSEVNKEAAKGLVSKVNDRYTKDPTTEPHNILGYWEVEFILAEASLRGWISSDAKQHYENGVKASYEFYNTFAKGLGEYVSGDRASTYLNNANVNFDNATTTEQKLEKIITQKYFTTFLQSGWNAYFEYLRTGYPEFVITNNMTAPKRWMYPQSEYDNNKEQVSEAISNQFGAGNDKVTETPWWLK